MKKSTRRDNTSSIHTQKSEYNTCSAFTVHHIESAAHRSAIRDFGGCIFIFHLVHNRWSELLFFFFCTVAPTFLGSLKLIIPDQTTKRYLCCLPATTFSFQKPENSLEYPVSPTSPTVYTPSAPTNSLSTYKNEIQHVTEQI